jgi:hypothetical protein
LRFAPENSFGRDCNISRRVNNDRTLAAELESKRGKVLRSGCCNYAGYAGIAGVEDLKIKLDREFAPEKSRERTMVP